MTRVNTVGLHYACTVLRKTHIYGTRLSQLTLDKQTPKERPSMARRNDVSLHVAYTLVRKHTLCPSSLFDFP